MSYGHVEERNTKLRKKIPWGKICQNRQNQMMAMMIIAIISINMKWIAEGALKGAIDMAIFLNQVKQYLFLDIIPKKNINTARSGQQNQYFNQRAYYSRPQTLPLSWPAECDNIISYYAPRGQGFHYGIDITCQPLSPIFAADDGIVAQVADNPRSDYGRMIVIDHENGIITYYIHLDGFMVNLGQRVARNQSIGTMGQTGNAMGTVEHLHFQVRENGRIRDPMIFLQKQ